MPPDGKTSSSIVLSEAGRAVAESQDLDCIHGPQKLGFRRALPHNLLITPVPPTRIDTRASSPTDARLGRIVRLLSDNATVVISGQRIAEQLGTSRSEVWRAVQYLRQLGVQITGHLATGYQLMAVPDLLLPDALSPMLSGTIFGSHIRHYFSIGSTNVAAMQAAAEGAPEGAVFLAEEQTAGRGRGDHTWDSAASLGIYCSVVLCPQMSPLDALFLSLMTGLAVADAVEHTTGLHPDLRWPNDVLLNGRKFCGVLTEMNAEPTRVRYVVIGIGLNVNHESFAGELHPIATSLRMESGREWSRVALTAALLKSLDAHYRRLAEGRPGEHAEIIRSFEQRSSWARSRRVVVADNGSGYEGVTEGLNDRGFLMLRVGDQLRTVLSGNVRAADGT
ncbi:MAG TPA: biotin--[acetyl-CoA-carboxylase] ligase [Terriglobales bacterium]|nr:biotin--[acetyl-CoA-carboxylase] ligase [Terriglobales bacterium]